MLEIEIINIEPIEGGVQVFARAWKNGTQIGFGTDGSVDIERFRIFNPPILVPDENGEVYRYATQEELDRDEHGLIKPVMRYREDAKEATLIALSETILDIAKFDDSKIVFRKVGNTTSTFYSNSSAEDGEVGYGRASWDTTHDAGTGTAASATGTQPRFQTGNNNLSTGWENVRAFFAFDTAALGDGDTITSATLSLRGTARIDNGNKSACLVGASPASATTLTTADYDQCGAINNPTEMASRLDITSWSTTGFNAFALNSNGLANISKTGISYFGLRSSGDCDDDITGIGLNEYSSCIFYSNEQSGNTDAPKLVVEHSSSTNVTVNPVAQSITASIPAYSVKKGVTQAPSAQALTASIPAYTVRLPKTVSVSPQSIVASIPAYTIDAGGNVSVAVAAQSLTLSVPAYAILLDTVFSPSPQTLTLSTPAASLILGTGVVVSPEAQTATLSIVTPVITAQRSIIVSVATQILTLSLPTLAKVGGVWSKRPRQTDADWGARARQTDSDWSKTPANDT